MATTVTTPKKNKRPEGVSRRDLLMIPFSHIEVEPDFNLRLNDGDLNELAESIRQNGVKDPLVVQKGKGNKWIVRSGHRRHKALQMLIDSGQDVGKIPCELEKKDLSKEQRIIDMVLYNNGLPFNMLELGFIFDRLRKFNYEAKEIKEKLGIPHINKVYDALKLVDSPKVIRNQIVNDKISTVAVLQIIKECGSGEDGNVDWDKAEKMVTGALKAVDRDHTKIDKEKKTATTRHVRGLRDKTPIQKIFSVVERAEKRPQSYDARKIAFLKELVELLKQKSTEDAIMELVRKKR